MQALRKCFDNICPSTLGEVFPLLMIAFAAQKLEYGMEAVLGPGFWSDVYMWRHALPTSEDMALFSEGVACLVASALSEGLQGQAGRDYAYPTRLTPVDQSDLLSRLKKGSVLNVCAHYLDRE